MQPYALLIMHRRIVQAILSYHFVLPIYTSSSAHMQKDCEIVKSVPAFTPIHMCNAECCVATLKLMCVILCAKFHAFHLCLLIQVAHGIFKH